MATIMTQAYENFDGYLQENFNANKELHVRKRTSTTPKTKHVQENFDDTENYTRARELRRQRTTHEQENFDVTENYTRARELRRQRATHEQENFVNNENYARASKHRELREQNRTSTASKWEHANENFDGTVKDERHI
ncbi:hypothetical protein PoB_006699000 [Plakobranchus ocellatus]|uniref:Uncharacterized protein n=1 Tax=Plakobranchus ocellatus TaxID=259542 RepID=A0AAV4D944_9GAST|nr:hypothetical protein PoB_006699000 [Plakobranchus ocellatus]